MTSFADRIMHKFRGNSEDQTVEDPNSAENKALSYARGAGGNGLAAEAADWILNLAAPRDPNNTYAGQTTQQSLAGLTPGGELLASTRDPSNTYSGQTPGDSLENDSVEAARRYQGANRIGSEQVALPLTALASTVIPGGWSVPARALAQAIPGALHGGYTAPGGENRAENAALGAGTAALTSLAGDAAQASGLGPALLRMAGPQLKQAGQYLRDKFTTPDLTNEAQLLERPTIPPPAVSSQAKQMASGEAGMRPPASAQAESIGNSTRGMKEPKLPGEFRGKNRPGVGPDDEIFPKDDPADVTRYERDFRNRRKATVKAEADQPGGGLQRTPEPDRRVTSSETSEKHTLPVDYAKGADDPFLPEYNPRSASPTAPTGRPESKTLPHRFAEPEAKVGLPEYSSVAPSNDVSTLRPSTFRPPSVEPIRDSELYSMSEELLPARAAESVYPSQSPTVAPGFQERLLSLAPPPAQSVPPMSVPPTPRPAMLPPPESTPPASLTPEMDTYLRAPGLPTVPRNPMDIRDVEDFTREFNKKHDIGEKTARPKRKKG